MLDYEGKLICPACRRNGSCRLQVSSLRFFLARTDYFLSF
ncbi:hypothetical protein JI665_27770 [Bacillus sp. NTK034]|nr:hypothetical protein [Bacillus sp. NTK034]